MYRFDTGATATLETVWCMPEKTPFDIDERMSVIGSDGFVHVQDTFPNIGICTKDGFRSPDTTYWPTLHGATSGALVAELSYFANCCATNTAPAIITPEESMAALEAWRPRNPPRPARLCTYRNRSGRTSEPAVTARMLP